MNRRQLLKAAAFGAAWAMVGRLLPGFAWGAPTGGKRPNLVLIMADDMGYSDIGCYGGEVQTPNIDRLAAGGVRFTQCYNGARCCPTRASLLTGLYAHQAGVGHMTDAPKPFPGYLGHLNDRCVTLAEALKSAGYATLMSGKWHVGARNPNHPNDRGFDEYYGIISGGTSYWKADWGPNMNRNGQVEKVTDEKFYVTDAFSDAAIGFLDRYGRGEKPFFLYLAYTAPHWPLHAWPADIAKYRDLYMKGWDELRAARHKRQIDMGLIRPEWKITDRDAPAWADVEDKEDKALRMAVYAAQIDRMDQGIGRVLAKLKELGAEENTLVLFLSDNGGCAEIIKAGKAGVPVGEAGSWQSYGKGWANLSNTPFRLYKHWVHEGGIATPLIAYWPAVIRRAGELVHEPTHIVDVMPTFVEAASGEYPKTRDGKDVLPMEGRSIVPILAGKAPAAREALYWEHEGNRAVRQGKWKLVGRHKQPWELYDMEADRTETADLAARNPAQVQELVAMYDRWARRCNVEPWDKVTQARTPPAKTED